MILPFKNKIPKIHNSVFVAPGAQVIGRVMIGRGASVWFGSVLRGDINFIKVGEGTNIQDGSVLHVDHDAPCIVGKNVIIGHQACVHGCTIGDSTLVGIQATILSGAKVGKQCLIGAGAVVLENAVIPDGSLVLGVPGKVVRKLTPKEIAKLGPHAASYVKLGKEYKKFLG
jgi:carbonic anhydrase/acetyltransferase-like protein (isoleucine patch superfamily)